MTDAARTKATVYVAGLDHVVDERVLADAFMPFGPIVDISIPKPEVQTAAEPHRGFGYVEFESPSDASDAIDNMDQSELYGRVIKVAQANPQKHAKENLGSKTAIWEHEGYLAKHAASLATTQESNPDTGKAEKDEIDVGSMDVAGPTEA